MPELGGEVLALVVWFLFGAGLVPVALGEIGPALILYALLSLTLVRMLPVALSMVGTGLSRKDVVFMGWFGPRGLASVVFALLAIEQLGEAEQALSQSVAAARASLAAPATGLLRRRPNGGPLGLSRPVSVPS